MGKQNSLVEDLKGCIFLFRTSFVIPIGVIGAIVLLCFYNDPPVFPLPDGSDIVDCSNIKVTQLYPENSRLKVELHVDKFIQYPRQLALSIIKLRADMNGIVFEYPMKNFWDIKSDLENISFCSLQTVGGSVNTSVMCDGRAIRSEILPINSVDIFPVGWSRLTFPHKYMGFLQSTFLFNDTIVFSAQPKSKFDNVRFSPNYTKTVAVDPLPAEQVRQKYGGKLIPKFAIMVAANTPSTFNQLIDVLYPFALVFQEIPNSTATVYLPNPTYNHTELFRNVPNITVLQNGTFLFEEIRIPKTSAGTFWPSVSPDNTTAGYYAEQLQFLASNQINMKRVRSWFTNSTKSGNVIVIDNNTRIYKDEIEKQFKCTIKEVTSNTTFDEMVEIMSNASAYVCGHSTTSVYATFLPDDAIFFEVPPDESSCSMFASWICKQRGVKYEFVYNSAKCVCTNFNCHMNKAPTYNGVKPSDLINKMKKYF